MPTKFDDYIIFSAQTGPECATAQTDPQPKQATTQSASQSKQAIQWCSPAHYLLKFDPLELHRYSMIIPQVLLFL